MNEILKLAQQGKVPFQIAEELCMHPDQVYRYTPASWYADPLAEDEALSKPPLSLASAYYEQQKLDAEPNGHYQEEQRITRNLKKCWFKSYKAYHGTKMDVF